MTNDEIFREVIKVEVEKVCSVSVPVAGQCFAVQLFNKTAGLWFEL